MPSHPKLPKSRKPAQQAAYSAESEFALHRRFQLAVLIFALWVGFLVWMVLRS